LPYRVVKYVQSEGQSAREQVASFTEKWEADEFAKSQSIHRKAQGLEGIRYEVEESTSVPKPLTLGAALKTISELIAEAIGLSGGRAELKQIYRVVKQAKPNSSEHSIRGVLTHAVEERKFVRHPDHTYSLGSKGPKQSKVTDITSSGVILEKKLFVPYTFSGPKAEARLETVVIQNYRQVLGNGTLYLPIKKLIGSRLKKITDGLLLDFNDFQRPRFWIVEAELSSHKLEHIQNQVMGFLRALEDEKTLRMLVKTVRDFIYDSKDANDVWMRTFFVPHWEGTGPTDYEFLDDLLHEKCGILIIIDHVTGDLEEIVRFLSKWGTVKVVEFKTFRADEEFLHTFSRPDFSQSD
jgi:hypothetical protein